MVIAKSSNCDADNAAPEELLSAFLKGLSFN